MSSDARIGEVVSRPPVGMDRSSRPHRGTRRRKLSRYWLFILPAAAFYVFIVLWPSARGAGLAFTNWDGLSPQKTFTGLKNFEELFTDSQALGAIGHTFLIAVVITIIQNLIGLLLALGVNSRIKTRGLLRVILFAPAVITPIAAGYLWQNLYSPSGAINDVLSTLTHGAFAPSWLGDGQLALWSVCIVIIWEFAGYSMVIFLANMQSIPDDIIEASYVDGAGAWRRFWSVVRPELAPSITINLMLSIIGGLKIFDQVWVLTQGGPANATDTLSTLLYKTAFQLGQFSYAIAMALILTVIVAVISFGQYRLLSRQGED